MGYKEKKEKLYELISQIAADRFNVACIRADKVTSSGYDLLAKIHELISRAELVIAEISELSPNVFYEVGYAVGVQKPPMLLIERGHEVPTDLKGLEVVEYENTMGGIDTFQADFFEHLRSRMNSDLAVLRDMLEPPAPQPSIIVASPKYPGKHSRILGQVWDRRTFGDHLGILGLISAFGTMRGDSRGIDLISAQHSPPDLLKLDANLYLIGSRKVNPRAREALDRIQEGKEPQWSFGPYPDGTPPKGDWTVALYKIAGGKRALVRGKAERLGPGREWVWTTDYGIIVRGPHPEHPGRSILVMAGSHSLGTGAACLAATRSSLIHEIRRKLPPGVLENKSVAFWALVKGSVNRKGFLLDDSGVSIVEASVYAPTTACPSPKPGPH
jgi:hypothetical protein